MNSTCRKLTMLDCFCGMGGVSDGFAAEGYEVIGIDIADSPGFLGYKHSFIRADIRDLNGKDFQGFDVIWGSPPCRDFSQMGACIGKTWKRPQDPEYGLSIVRAFVKFVEDAQPTFWIMENVDRMKKFYSGPSIQKARIKGGKKHVFYGNFPAFLLPEGDPKNKVACGLRMDKTQYMKSHGYDRETVSWTNAKIPLSCSRAFARACKEALLEPMEACIS